MQAKQNIIQCIQWQWQWQWQWQGYPHYHRQRLNLLIHIVSVPTFLCGHLVILLGLLQLQTGSIVLGVLICLLAFAAQGLGHKHEPLPSIPFSSPSNAIARVLIEQWINFPRFVLSGGWWRALTQP